MRKILRILPDKLYISLLYYKHFKRFPNLKNPETFNEKLQWLKLHDRKPEYTTMVDKHLVKQYIAEKLGDEYVIPTLGAWNTPEEIDFDSLPEQFVLKWNHDSGSIVICKDKSSFDKNEAVKKLLVGKKKNGFWYGREWPYKNVKPRIIAEQYMEDEKTEELRDYKFFCFNGEPKAMFIATDRAKANAETKFDFFDMEFTHLPCKNGHPNSEKPIQKPEQFELMIEFSRKLSKDIPHVRIDFYEVNGHVYFGEMTFFHFSGMVPFDPPEWDKKLGDLLELKTKKQFEKLK